MKWSNFKFLPLLIILINATVFNLSAQTNSERSAYYFAGTKASSKYFNTLMLQTIDLCKEQKIDETTLLSQYALIERRYATQEDTIALLAQELVQLPTSNWSKKFKKNLQLFAKGNTDEALQQLLQKKYRLNPSEQQAAYLIFKLSAHDSESLFFLAPSVKDSLAQVWEHRYDNLPQLNTKAFITNKIYAAQKLAQDNELDAALGLLLEADKWVQQLPDANTDKIKLGASIAYLLAAHYLEKGAIDPAYRFAKNLEAYYNTNSNLGTVREKIAAKHLLAKIYKISGAMHEALVNYEALIEQYASFSEDYPEYYLPKKATAHEEYGEVLQYLDRFADYESQLRKAIAIRNTIASWGNPYLNIALALCYKNLGHKLMNTDLKLELAKKEWLLAKSTFDNLEHKIPLMSWVNPYCQVLYSLAMSEYAVKNYAAAIPFFNHSLELRTRMMSFSPDNNEGEYINILMQNATNYFYNKDKKPSLECIDKAIKITEQYHYTDRTKAIENFKLEVEKL